MGDAIIRYYVVNLLNAKTISLKVVYINIQDFMIQEI